MSNNITVVVIFVIATTLIGGCNRTSRLRNISSKQTNSANTKTANNENSSLKSLIDEQDFSKTQTVSYCELIKNQAKYDHKIVRVRAIYFTAFENTLLYDQTCEPGKPPTAPDKVPAETWAEWDKSFVSKGDSEEAKLNRQLNGFGRKDVTLIGKFNSTNEQNERGGSNLFGHLNCCRFQFQIIRLEKIVTQATDEEEKTKIVVAPVEQLLNEEIANRFYKTSGSNGER